MRIILLCGILFLVSSCNLGQSKPIQTNMFYQQDYDYFCFDETKTWSQIVVCLTAEGKAERTQNKITNDLLDNQ